MRHLALEDYLDVLRGRATAADLVAKAKAHLGELARSDAGDAVPADPRLLSRSHLESAKRRLSRMREAAREARKDLARLSRRPRSEWHRLVANARTRYRSRAFAQLLVAEGRRSLADDPATAAALAALVPAALAWARRNPDLAWAEELVAEAAALGEAAAGGGEEAQTSKRR